ncbi:tetratricopeptide repeat protein [Microbulbifer halophilus]|uniref:tetratricopeptide repeat protein n=1 Tax=Microbulbifer halophilus TaxID=453963 RepID=UPI00360FF10D
MEVTKGRNDWRSLLTRARVYAELNRADRAVETLLRIRRSAPDNLYTNYARAQVYITIGDQLSAKAHMRKTLEQGMSPIWFETARFSPMCAHGEFADLREEYPALCDGQTPGTRIAQK